MKTPNNFEEKLKEELENFYIDLIGGCPEKKDYYFIKKSVKAISTLCEEEVKRARISELKGLKMYDCFNEDYTNDPRPAKLVSIRLVELEKDNK